MITFQKLISIANAGPARTVALRSFLERISDLHSSGVADVVLGFDTAAPPLPATSCMRVNLLDVAANLQALVSHWQHTTCQNCDESIEEGQTRRHNTDRRVWEGSKSREPEDYYDLSVLHTTHLESPHGISCFQDLRQGVQTAQQLEAAMKLRADALEDVVAGRPFCRGSPANATQYAAGSLSDQAHGGGVQLHDSILRGGCTVIFRAELLRVAQDAWRGRR
jgi:hypothetical protein